MKKILSTLFLLIPLMAILQSCDNEDGFVALFPEMDPNGLCVYYDTEHEAYWGQGSLPEGKFLGVMKDHSLWPELRNAKVQRVRDLFSEDFPDQDFYAVGRFPLDKKHEALICRYYGYNYAPEIMLMVWDKESKAIVDSKELAWIGSEEGFFFEGRSWLEYKKKNLRIVISHYSMGVDPYEWQEEIKRMREKGDFSRFPSPVLTDFNEGIWVFDWSEGKFVADTTTKTLDFSSKYRLPSMSEDCSLWGMRYVKDGQCSAHPDSCWIMGVDENEVNPPHFEGGEKAFREWIANNITLPSKVSGEVWARITIDYDGSIIGTYLLKDAGTGSGEAVCNLLRQSPRWAPAMTKQHFWNEDFRNAAMQSQVTVKLKLKNGRVQL